jgi:hypothetical protein
MLIIRSYTRLCCSTGWGKDMQCDESAEDVNAPQLHRWNLLDRLHNEDTQRWMLALLVLSTFIISAADWEHAPAARHSERGEANAHIVGELEVGEHSAGALLDDDGSPAHKTHEVLESDGVASMSSAVGGKPRPQCSFIYTAVLGQCHPPSDGRGMWSDAALSPYESCPTVSLQHVFAVRALLTSRPATACARSR